MTTAWIMTLVIWTAPPDPQIVYDVHIEVRTKYDCELVGEQLRTQLKTQTRGEVSYFCNEKHSSERRAL